MAFKRAVWHSGLTYQWICNKCHTTIRYTDYQLDFRPWYPDGFIYCPKCKTPLRHNENNAINPDGTPYYKVTVHRGYNPSTMEAPQPAPDAYAPDPSGQYKFCPDCGRKHLVGDKFCPSCGRDLTQP